MVSDLGACQARIGKPIADAANQLKPAPQRGCVSPHNDKNQHNLGILSPDRHRFRVSSNRGTMPMPGGGDPDPERLLQEARSGENRALGQLLEMYRSYLTLFSQLQIDSRMQGKADPSDLVQETFLQAQRGFDQFRGNTERELLGWLRRILVSQLAKLVRRFYGTQRRDSRLERELEEDFDRSSQAARMLIAPHSSPSQGAMRREQVVLMADALEKLPKDYREVIVLRHFKDLSFPEVARRLGRSEEAVKKTWARALVALREAFGEATDERQ